MKTFWVIVTLANGLTFAGALNARNEGHARTIVHAESVTRNIAQIDVEEV